MGIAEAALWGVLQGLTEFLPVSSSGHLVLVPWLLGRTPPGFTYDVAVHFATLLAVLLFFRAEVLMLLRGALDLVTRRRLDTPEARLAWFVILGSIPAVLVGALLKSTFDQLFGAPPVVALLLLVTGLVLYLADRAGPRPVSRAPAIEAGAEDARDMGQLGLRDAFTIGLAQAVALAPGISRSGATISAGLFRGLSRPEAARFSFVLSIPAVFGAAALEALDTLQAGTAVAWPLIIAGMVAAFVSGYFALGLLFRVLQRRGLTVFAIYCWALSLVSLIVYAVRQGLA
jgi:undecaprenyl-diphosphatase